MSRSVETIGNNVIYFDCSNFDPEIGWDDLILNIQSEVEASYPSFVSQKNKWAKYPYRENRIILENNFVSITISEYCGCGAISVFVNEDYIDDKQGTLAESWLNKTLPGLHKIISKYIDELKYVATFSNGEAVYERLKNDK